MDYRNTPQEGMEHSPAQRLLCRRTRGFLPMTPALLKPKIVDQAAVKTQIEYRRARAKCYHDRGLSGAPLEAIHPGQHVYMKPNPQHKHSAWPYGVVQKMTTPRSYSVLTPGGKEIGRNRAHVRLAAAPPPGAKTYLSVDPQESDTSDDNVTSHDFPVEPTCNNPKPQTASVPRQNTPPVSPPQPAKQITTRSGRIIKAPDILDL